MVFVLLFILLLLIGGSAGALMYVVQGKRRAKNVLRAQSLVRLRVLIPKKEQPPDRQRETDQEMKITIGAAEQFFTSLHSIFKRGMDAFVYGQDFICLEIAATDTDSDNAEEEISFYVLTPPELRQTIEKQITAYYPEAIVEEDNRMSLVTEGSTAVGTVLHQNKPFPYPIKTFRKLDVDPLNDITNALGAMQSKESAAVQIIIRPRSHSWVTRSKSLARRIRKQRTISMNRFVVAADAVTKGLHSSKNQAPVDLSQTQQDQMKAIEEKTSKVGFDTVIRLIATSPDKSRAEAQLASMITTFAQFEDPNLNGINARSSQKYSANSAELFINHTIDGSDSCLLNAEELASIFHFPNSLYNKTPSIKWQLSKIAPAPALLASEGLILGHNRYRSLTREIYLSSKDRFRHLYIIGQTGSGKSVLLKTLAKQDIKNGNGLCVVDPHGDLIDDLLEWIPKERAGDVVLFDPADSSRPMGLNLLEARTSDEKDFIALDAMNMMIGLFGSEIFGPRIQDYFRNGCLTLMDDEEEGGALTDIVRLFTDPQWQQYKVKKVKNPIVKSFWSKQMAATGAREKEEMIPFLAAKFGAFVTNSTMRNIVGQTRSAFNFGDVMNSKKILLVKLSKGLIGEINAHLLGMIFVNKIQVAAMRRASMPETERTPFFLYVDEFQNFVTSAFESILSEARKYKLGLTIAHQYIGQLQNKPGYESGNNDAIRNAVFGNVGTMINFKIGAQDAEYIAKEMSPVFSNNDLINLDQFHACIKISINGAISQPFSMTTVKDFEKGNTESAGAIRELSRLTYGRNADEVNREILSRLGSVDIAQLGQSVTTPNG